jgi:hypothetical protein
VRQQSAKPRLRRLRRLHTAGAGPAYALPGCQRCGQLHFLLLRRRRRRRACGVGWGAIGGGVGGLKAQQRQPRRVILAYLGQGVRG